MPLALIGSEGAHVAGQDDAVPVDAELVAARELDPLAPRCCPFLDFRIDVGAGRSALALQVTAAADVKEFLRAELGLD